MKFLAVGNLVGQAGLKNLNNKNIKNKKEK